MSNDVFASLFRERIRVFRAAFSSVATEAFYDVDQKKLRHTGEYGTYREAIVRELLTFLIPRSLRLSTGFVITTMNDVSTQCDIVAFDPTMTPLYVDGERQRFFPVESIFCVGEVKSTVSKTHLRQALNKLARTKALGERIEPPVTILRKSPPGPFDPIDHQYDAVPTFLLCQKLAFDTSNIEAEVDTLYDPDVLHRHKHNMVISVDDGILLYADDNRMSIPYPRFGSRDLKHRFIAPHENVDVHLNYFGNYMFMMTTSKTLLYPEFGNYAGGASGGLCRDQPIDSGTLE